MGERRAGALVDVKAESVLEVDWLVCSTWAKAEPAKRITEKQVKIT